MTAAILQSGLSSLFQDSKKKSPDVRAAAEKSLGELKSLSITSETQLAGDLVRRLHFVDAFVLACHSKNSKLASIGVVCLQRLAASRALPRERLKDVVEAFREVTSYGLDVQLKILQTLPSLLQIYAQDLNGDLLAATLGVCGDLQDNKTAVVSSTATATFQQLITTVYEKVGYEDNAKSRKTETNSDKAHQQEDLGPASHDAYRIFNDLCAFANGGELEFLRIRSVSVAFVLEIIDGILRNSEEIFQRHPEQVEACRTHLMPAITKILSGKQNFALAVRSARILSMLITRYVGRMSDESETCLNLLMRGLEYNSGLAWKRALYVELFRGLCSDARLLRQMFLMFDQKDGRTNIIGNIMSAFVRIASEKPALIGIGSQSTAPFQRGGADGMDSQGVSLDAAGATGIIGGAVSADSNVTGISTEWSTMRTAYMDQLDKTDAQEPPTTYVYGLVLNCIAVFSEGLAKYVMPLSVPPKGRTQRQQRTEVTNEEEGDDAAERTGLVISTSESANVNLSASAKHNMLINPLKFTSQAQLDNVKICAAMIEACWPAFLATCSTFFNAALDADFYHTLVRSFQKLTQVAGVLELSTPRDAMLTTLAKAAVPTGTISSTTPTSNGKAHSRVPSSAGYPAESDTGSINDAEQASLSDISRRSIDRERPMISTRNLLCLRALLNLGIALGPTLAPDSWFTILETLQHAEVVIDLSSKIVAQGANRDENSSTTATRPKANLSAEISAVQMASRRMFDASAGYSNESLHSLLVTLLRFSGGEIPEKEQGSAMLSPLQSTPTSPRQRGRMHQYSRSISVSLTKAGPQEDELRFFFTRISDVARVNLTRLISAHPRESGWEVIFHGLFHVATLEEVSNSLRVQSVALMNRIVVESMKSLSDDDHELNGELQLRCLNVFRSQQNILSKYDFSLKAEPSPLSTEIDVRLLGELHSVLEACTDFIPEGWAIVFGIICSPFDANAHGILESAQSGDRNQVEAKSQVLVQPAFACLQLIGSDFLTLLDAPCLALFINALSLFSGQGDNFNIALTSTNFFWNLATYLQTQIGHTQIQWMELNSIDEIRKAHLKEEDKSNSHVAVWLLLVTRLIQLTNDGREDVRDSSIRIVTRVLDLFAQNLSPDAWIMCLQLALDAMGYQCQQANVQERVRWQNSLIMMTEAVLGLQKQNTEVIARADKFLDMLQRLFKIFAHMLELESLNVAAVVYNGASNLLRSLKSREIVGNALASSALLLWEVHHPADISPTGPKSEGLAATRVPEKSNQQALTQHAEVFLTVHELFTDTASHLVDIDVTLESVYKTVFECVHPQYASDFNRLSSEQEKVLAMLPILFKSMESRRTDYLRLLLRFVSAALLDAKTFDWNGTDRTNSRNSAKLQRSSFMAFSSRCIDVLETTVNDSKIIDFSLVESLDTLSNVIESKHTSISQSTDPGLWENATTKAIKIFENIDSRLKEHTDSHADSDVVLSYLAAHVNVATSVLGSGPVPDADKPLSPKLQASLLSSESFDIPAFMRFNELISTTLPIWYDKSPVCRQTCASYALLLLKTSFIATPFFGDLSNDLLNHPLSKFSSIRPGTVCAPVYPSRLQIPYVALSTLFDLVASSTAKPLLTSGPEATASSNLATCATPYLLIRLAWTFKTFIADQPLRGLTPLPRRLRTDMLIVITKCLDTKTYDDAFNELLSSHSPRPDGKNHLRILYPLVLKVLNVWRRVPRLKGGGDWMEEPEAMEIEQKLNEWLRVVGADWEVKTLAGYE